MTDIRKLTVKELIELKTAVNAEIELRCDIIDVDNSFLFTRLCNLWCDFVTKRCTSFYINLPVHVNFETNTPNSYAAPSYTTDIEIDDDILTKTVNELPTFQRTFDGLDNTISEINELTQHLADAHNCEIDTIRHLVAKWWSKQEDI